MKHYLIFIFITTTSFIFSQEEKKPFTETEVSVSKWIDGTLLTPKDAKKPSLAIIIAGSGPTNRNGNQNFLKNNSLKKLAEGITNNGIATFRYDKRVVKQIRQGNVDKNMLFDDFVTDANDVIIHFKATKQFSKIYVIGHSQGSLVGMLAAKNKADGFISLAGAAQNIGDVLIEQITKMAPQFEAETKRIVNSLKNGKTTKEYPVALASVFNEELQPFMINWMSYNPEDLIKSIDMPILIINGTKDLQVSESEAQLLKAANPKSELLIIENMNHVLFTIEGNELENSKSYNEAFRPVSPLLITRIKDFIKS